MTPLARKLTDLGQAADLSDQDLIEAIRWFAVRGIGFTVSTAYDSDGDITGYYIKRD
jgi:hypothetical protein